MFFRLVVFGLLLLGCTSSLAQTTLNPDISAVGDFRMLGHNDATQPAQKDEINLADPVLELNIGGYLNPYARADAVVAWHEGHNAAVEEL
jgi:hypothetical protein